MRRRRRSVSDQVAVDALTVRIAQSPDSTLSAFTQLLARWQVDSSETSVRDATRCAPAIAPGIHCLRGRASLEQLARFDRPLILVLRADTASAGAVLLGVGAKKLRLDLAGDRYELDHEDLPGLWDGQFIAIWRQPADIPPTLKRGDSGPAVVWTRKRLAAFDGAAATEPPSAQFDAELETRVRNLQQRYGINADGIIGPETLFALSALDDAGPHLARTVE